MVWTLLRRGLLVGAVAGLLAGTFAFVVGEPLLQDAIDFEERAAASVSAVPASARAGEPVIDRGAQRGGLFLATLLYGIVIGGLFAVAFAVLRGRGARRSDWQLATRLAAGLFVAGVLVPFLKYPANPPAVGDPGTIADRTIYYVVMLVGCLLALLAAARVVWSVPDEAPPWRRPVLAGGTFVAVTAFLGLVLPGVQEIPPGFPAALMWEFRLSSLGTQVVLWTALGVGFGIASGRAAAPRRRTAAA